MSRAPCAMAPLVEARRDKRLDPRDAASVERHLAACASCAELVADLDLLGQLARREVPGASPIEQRRGRMRLLREAARHEGRSAAARWAGLAVALVGATALAIALMTSLQPAPARALVLSGFSVPAGLIERAPLSTVRPSEGARFTREERGGVHIVTLEAGALDVEVQPLKEGERFLVRTSDAEVEVRGTKFRVEASDGLLQLVSVAEGKVEVRPRAGERALIEPGGVWRPSPPAVAPAAAPAASSSSSSTSTSTGAAAPRAPSKAGADETSTAFREAMRAMEDGDYATAADRLKGFSQAHPDDARAEDAAFLAVLSLERAGRREAAVQAARRYLERFPNGFRRAEAEAIASSKPPR